MTDQISIFDDERDQITYLARAQIRLPGGFDPRQLVDPDAIRALGDDIRARGMYHPIHVCEIDPTPGSPQRYEVVAGKQRYLASGSAGLDPIPCIIHRDLSQAQTEILAINENWLRSDPCALDVARTVGLLRERRLGRGEPATNVAIGAIFHHVDTWVSERVTIYEALIQSGLVEQAKIPEQDLLRLTKDALKKAADSTTDGARIRALQAAARALPPLTEDDPASRTRTRRDHPAFEVRTHSLTGGVSVRMDPARMSDDDKAIARGVLVPHLEGLGFMIDSKRPKKIRVPS